MRLLALLVLLFATTTAAEEMHIGFLSLDHDPRYEGSAAERRVDPMPRGNALAGAELGIEDTKFAAQAAGIAVVLDARSGKDAAEIAALLAAMDDEVVLLDLPAEIVTALPAGGPLLINVSAPEDALRCMPGMLHAAPSDRMLSDALAQYLVTRKWTRVLVLAGESGRDAEIAKSFADAAARYRLTVVDTRAFTLAADPARRDLHNPLLLTADLDYDVVFVADGSGDFAPYLPYATALPRPVIGSAGLVALAWHHAFDMFGAPQVNSRFVRVAKRYMTGADWSAWMAVKAVVQAKLKGPAPGDEALAIDGSKGTAMSFRPWDGQLRMPILLATDAQVIAMAPLTGFAHEHDDLDTLGTDAPEAACP